MAGEEAAQPGDRVGVEVVGRLVQQQRAAAVLARVANRIRASSMRRRWPPESVPHRLAEHPVGQAEVGADPGGLGLGGVTAEPGEPVLQGTVAANRFVGWVRRPVAVSRRFMSAEHGVEAAGREHPVAGGDRRGRRCGDPAAGSRPGRGARPHRCGACPRRPAPSAWWSCRRRCARRGRSGRRAVRAGRLAEQDAGAGAQFQAGGVDHRGSRSRCSNVTGQSRRLHRPPRMGTRSVRGRSVFAAEHATSVAGPGPGINSS